MAKLFEEEVVKSADERLLDLINELVHIKDADDNIVGSWCTIDEIDLDGKSEEEIIKFALDNGFKVFKMKADGEIDDNVVIAASDVESEKIKDDFKVATDIDVDLEEVEPEKKQEGLHESFHARALKEQQLKENTSNFNTQEKFDLWAISDKELVGFDNWEQEEKDAYENGDYNYFEIIAREQLDEVESFCDQLSDELKFFDITTKGGYFDGLQTYVFPKCNRGSGRDFEYDDIESAIYEEASDLEYYEGMSEEEAEKKAKEEVEAEVEKINKEILPKFKDYGFYRLGVVGRFSNGETIYSKVEESVHDNSRPAFEAGKLDAEGQVIERSAHFFDDEDEAVEYALNNDCDYVTGYTYDENDDLPSGSFAVWSKNSKEETDEGLKEDKEEVKEPERLEKVLDRETKEFLLYKLFNEIEDYEKAKANLDREWKISNDKSLDPVRNEDDDKEYPWVLLVDGKFADALNSDFGDRIYWSRMTEGNSKRKKATRNSLQFFVGYEPLNSDGSKPDHGFDGGDGAGEVGAAE